MSDNSSVEVSHLTKVFPSRRRGSVTAVDDVSFSIRRNEVVGILGANGAGKTTTIKCLCGLVRPTSGSIVVEGVNVTSNPRQVAGKLGTLLEGNRNIYWRLTARENVDFFAGLAGVSRSRGAEYRDELLERFGLAEKARTPARMLSRGMQQKLALVCALARRGPLLLLDEPTLGLDVEVSVELRNYLKELAIQEHTILLSSHDMNVVQSVCNRVLVLVDGRLVADDRVSNLLALFRAQAYEFVVSGRLSDSQQIALKERFQILQIDSHDSQTTIGVEFVDNRGIYDLVNILDSQRSVVESIHSQEPNLEQVFLQLVRGARGG